MNSKELLIKKASALIQTNVKGLTLTQRKLINAFIYVAQQNGNQIRYQIPTVKLKDYCGIDMKGNNDLKDQIKKLLGIVIEFNYLNKDKKNKWEVTTLISGAGIEEGCKHIEFEFSGFLKEKILHPHMYAPLNILLIANLKSTYAIVLYEFLKDYIEVTVPELSIEQFRKLLGIEDNKYQVFQNLKTRVIDKSIDEINEKTDINCSYSLRKAQGNKNSHIRFSVKKNKDFKKLKELKGSADSNLHLFFDPATLPDEVLEILPQEYQINSVYHLVEPYFDNLDYLVSNIEYANKNCDKNFPSYLKLALENDYAKVNREMLGKRKELKKAKKNQMIKQENQEKLLKQKAWDHFHSLSEADQVRLREDAEEKMSAALRIVSDPQRRDDIVNAQIEKDLCAQAF